MEAHGALGYNSRRFFAGAQIIWSWAGYDQNGTSSVVLNKRMTFQIFAGYRFNAPDALNRFADKMAIW